jgi:hypothetical protein
MGYNSSFLHLKTGSHATLLSIFEPSHDNIIDTHVDDYNISTRQTFNTDVVGELHLTDLLKL